jgi:hypothetical protein
VRDGSQVKQGYLGNLGRVVDKEAGVFQSRERGLFRYTLEDGFCDLPASYAERQYAERQEPARKERLILDFGDSFFLHQYLERQACRDAFYQILPGYTDSLLSLMFYRILTDKKAYCYAEGKLRLVAVP